MSGSVYCCTLAPFTLDIETEKMSTNTIKKKLKSSRGASLSIALLLFLVCAVLGSVILKSATASSGRLAGVQEADQRYYSVNSAADLLASQLDGQTVHVNRAYTTTTPYVSTYTCDAYGNKELVATTEDRANITHDGPAYYAIQNDDPSNTINKDRDYDHFFTPGKIISSNSTLLISATNRFMFGFNEATSTGAPLPGTVWNHTTPVGDRNSTLETRTFILDHVSAYDYLDVNVVEQLRGDGTLVFVVSNIPEAGQTDSDVYEVRLTFTPTIKNKTARKTTESTGSYMEGDPDPTTGLGTGYITETETLYEYRYTAITWNLTEIKKAGLE